MSPQRKKTLAAIPSMFALLTKRRFAPLFCVQFLGAFNDNILKQALILSLVFSHDATQGGMLSSLAIGLFILPFFLLSPMAGMFADCFDKARLARRIKFAEIMLAMLAGVALYAGEIVLLFIVLFLMGTQSTFFGPIKYSLLPVHLPKNELLAGNALIEAGTFIAILAGTLLGGVLIIYHEGAVLVAMLLVAASGWLLSLLIPAAPAMDKKSYALFSLAPLRAPLRQIMDAPILLYAILAISLFLLMASIIVTQLPNFTAHILGGNEVIANALYAFFALGVLAGSLLVKFLLKSEMSVRYAPWGLFVMALFLMDAASIAYASPIVPYAPPQQLADLFLFPYLRIALDFFLVAMGASFYVVPCYTLLQYHSDDQHRARVIALSNISDSFFIVMGALCSLFMLGQGFSSADLFFMTAFAALLVIALVKKLDNHVNV